MLRLLLLVIALGSFANAPSYAAESTGRIALVGDSTMTARAGWGGAFTSMLSHYAKCVNFADPGASSKSFRDSGQWKKVLESRPDYILIQFGHNDMPGKGPERETVPQTTYRQNLTRYVQEARAIGAKPILITSLTRRTFDNGRIRGELKPWAYVALQVAKEQEIPVIDLFARSVALHNQLGPYASADFNPEGKRGKGNTDGAHLNAYGAKIIAQIVAEELRKAVPEFVKLLN